MYGRREKCHVAWQYRINNNVSVHNVKCNLSKLIRLPTKSSARATQPSFFHRPNLVNLKVASFVTDIHIVPHQKKMK